MTKLKDTKVEGKILQITLKDKKKNDWIRNITKIKDAKKSVATLTKRKQQLETRLTNKVSAQ